MTRASRQSLLTAVLWTVVAIGFLATALAGGGPATYSEDSSRRAVGAVFLAIGLFATPALRWWLRSRAKPHGVDHDERDDRIGAQATNAGLIIVMLVVFLLAIVLWERYQGAGCVPVGWMWILAYTSLILSHLVPAVAFLILDRGMVGRGQG